MKKYLFSFLLICFSTFVFAATPDSGPAPTGYQYDAVDQSVDNQVDTPHVGRSMPSDRFTATGETTRAEYNLTVKSAQYRSVNAIARANVPYEVGWQGDC